MIIEESGLKFCFEGNVKAKTFGCESRRKTTIMSELQKSIKKKLSWLNCLVSVVDSDTYNRELFRVE